MLDLIINCHKDVEFFAVQNCEDIASSDKTIKLQFAF